MSAVTVSFRAAVYGDPDECSDDKGANGKACDEGFAVVLPFGAPAALGDWIWKLSVAQVLDTSLDYINPVGEHQWEPMAVAGFTETKRKTPEHAAEA